MSKSDPHSAEFKAKVAIHAIQGDLSLHELASKYGVKASLIRAWKQALVHRMASDYEGVNEKANNMESQDLKDIVTEIVLAPEVMASASEKLQRG